MKILNIYFKNINSLEGESRINFMQPPISDSGVFAITGANGSGKSSILDAITLGLYGETFRFDRPASFVMTKNTTESFAAVEFQLDDNVYQSRWQVQRSDDNPQSDMLPPQMQLLRLADGAMLADNPLQVCKQIAELTGMNFRNFTRSILLAQGDFAAFLNALDAERLDILEKIISTDIYADYRKNITDKAEQAQQKLANLNKELAALKPLSADLIAAHQDDLSDFTARFEELQSQRQQFEQWQLALESAKALQTELAAAEQQQQASNEKIAAVDGQLAAIADNQAVLQFQDAVQAIGAQQQTVAATESTLVALQEELLQLKRLLGDIPLEADISGKTYSEQKKQIDELQAKANQARSNQQMETGLWQSLAAQLNDRKANKDNVAAWLAAHADDQALLIDFPETGKLKRLRTELAELTEKQKIFGKQNKKFINASKSLQSALAQATSKKQALELQLSTDEKDLESLLAGNTSETLKNLRIEQQERVDAFSQLLKLATSHKKLTKQKGGLFAVFKSQPAAEPLDIEALTLEFEKLSEAIKREENIKLTLEQARINEALVKKLTADRNHLVDGKPCALCGSTEHPYSKRPPVFGNSLKAAADQQLTLRTLAKASEQLQEKIAFAKKHQARNKAIAERVEELRGQWLSLCNRLNAVSSDLEINNLAAMTELLDTEQQELNEITALISKCRSKHTNIAKLTKDLEKNALLIEQLQARSGKLDNDSAGQSQEYKDIVAALTTCQQEEQALSEKITAQLAALGEKMPDKGKEDSLFDRLNTRRQEYQSYVLRQKNMDDELAALESKQAACQAEISHYNEVFELYDGQLQKAEIIGLHLAITEKQKLIADSQQMLAQQQQNARLLQQDLQEKLNNSRYKTLDELRQLLALQSRLPALEAEKNQVLQMLAEQQAELATLDKLWTEQLPKIQGLASLEELKQQLHSNREQIDIARLEMRRVQQVLGEQDNLQQQYQQLASQLQQQQQATDACMAEMALLSEEQGIAFRKKVQADIIAKLLSKTNAFLEKINGRYYLRQKPSDQGLALEIEDTLQSNARRLPKTLSGGETFVISLALALGLCELANNGKAVDSLFIDEGFGNLDAETLYTVITTLEGLQAHGKTVGVISHIDAVQKRIKAQFQVVKKANGMGELRKVS